MANIILISNHNSTTKEILSYIKDSGNEAELCDFAPDVILQFLKEKEADIILIDSEFENAEIITKQLRVQNCAKNTQIILILDKDKDNAFLNFADGYITKPISTNILLNTINSHVKIKKSLQQMSENNKELARSLYQLNVLYNTSSQFAGTLDKAKLYKIMLEAMEKTLSFDLSCLLVFKPEGGADFTINSLYEPTDSLKEALALRTMLGYKNIFENEVLPKKTTLDDVKITTLVKPSHKHNIFDLRALNFDSLFAPVKVGDDLVGVVELLRETPFGKEDVTCFQTIVHQVALPLRSATLYEEIKNTNIKLEKLERLKSDFISIVSHELRTPLTPINNSLEIVLSGQTGEITPDAKNFINMAKRNVARLSGIIEDLLDLSRIETGKLDIKYEKVNLAPSLELMQKTFEQTAVDKNINVSLEIENTLPDVYADIHRFEQILSNLVTNALKFTPDGGSVKISAKTVSDQDLIEKELIQPTVPLCGNYIQISTKDTGVGIKKEDISKIFEKFSQIENSLNRNVGGVGLGLTITKQLIDAHLGAIWVESSVNEGSDFSFVIPVFDEKKAFTMDLNHCLTSNYKVAIIAIKEPIDAGFVDFIKSENIIKLTKKSKEFECTEDGFHKYWAMICNIEENALNFMIKAIESEQLGSRFNNCDIILKSGFSRESEKNTQKFIEKLKL